MTNPATPLDNQTAIAQLNQALNFIVDNIVRPTALQTKANAEAIAAESIQVQALRQSVEGLRSVANDAIDENDGQNSRISDNESRFDVLIAEAREERRQSDERFAAQLAEIRAIGEQNRALLSALATTNRRVDDLEQVS